jgi:hypothetical protein
MPTHLMDSLYNFCYRFVVCTKLLALREGGVFFFSSGHVCRGSVFTLSTVFIIHHTLSDWRTVFEQITPVFVAIAV